MMLIMIGTTTKMVMMIMDTKLTDVMMRDRAVGVARGL